MGLHVDYGITGLKEHNEQGSSSYWLGLVSSENRKLIRNSEVNTDSSFELSPTSMEDYR